jgi:hypothetical protein
MRGTVRHGPNPSGALHRSRFTLEEDIKLRSLVNNLGTKNWDEIARFMPSRSARQCRDRFKNYLRDCLVTNPWTSQEDALVIRQYHLIGPKWVEIGKMLSGRSGNNVKNRWHKHLCKRCGGISVMHPNAFESTEDATLFEAYHTPTVDTSEWGRISRPFDPPGSSNSYSFDDPFF